jgi:Ca-activated chloride channel family protein
MAGALEAALVGSEDPTRVRQVVFLTDGSVAHEDHLFGLIRQRLGTTRLFTVGIGSAPNGHFMTRAAELGRGTFTYIGRLDEIEERMGRLFRSLESPVLTDVEVRWPGVDAVEAWPQRVGDLYAGEPLVVSARLAGDAQDAFLGAEVTMTGRRGHEPWLVTFPLDGGREGAGLSLLWARRKVQALLDSRQDGAAEDEVRDAVVALGLEHQLVTPYTSLVAVDVTPVRPPDADLTTRALPTLLPAGWTLGTVAGELPQTATAAPWHFALMAACFALGLVLWHAGRRPGRTRAW